MRTVDFLDAANRPRRSARLNQSGFIPSSQFGLRLLAQRMIPAGGGTVMRARRGIRVMLVDAKGLRSSLLKTLLKKTRPIFELVAESGDLESALQLTAMTQPDVVLVRLEMARQNERAFQSLVSNGKTKVLVLDDIPGDGDETAILRGAVGVVHADDSIDSLFAAMKSVYEGHLWLNRRAAGRLFVALTRPGFGAQCRARGSAVGTRPARHY